VLLGETGNVLLFFFERRVLNCFVEIYFSQRSPCWFYVKLQSHSPILISPRGTVAWDKEQVQYIPPAARQSFRYAARDSLESGQAAGELEVLPSQLRALPW